MSVDDIGLDSRPVSIPERRARSTSPIKNRCSLPPSFFDTKLPTLPYACEDDIKSISSGSNSSLSPKQLRLLSNSPAFRRLHVSTSPERSQYVIPIPFTLKLPPKLSHHNQNLQSPRSESPERLVRPGRYERDLSPTRSRSPKRPSRLVYNGSGYEKLESLSESDDGEHERSQRVPFNHRPAPPPVTTNKRRSKKQNSNAKLMSHYELSTIDEASSYANSRNASVKSAKVQKSLQMPPANQKINSGDVRCRDTYETPLITPMSVEKPDKFSFRVTPRPNAIIKDIYRARNPYHNQYLKDTSRRMLDSPVTRSTTDNNIRLHQTSNAPINSKHNILKNDRRSFSDESKVSSIRSFNSFGGELNTSLSPNFFVDNQTDTQLIRHGKFDAEFNKDVDTRAISNGSTTSHGSVVSSNASWNSLQKSIDINDSSDSVSVPETELAKPSTLLKTTKPNEDNFNGKVNQYDKTGSRKPVDACEGTDFSPVEESEFADLYLDESEVSVNDKSDFSVPIDRNLATCNESDNEGAGTRFNFPAARNNITNSKELKQEISPVGSLRSSAYITEYRSPSGQIEIPDLDDKSTTGNYYTHKPACSFNGTTFDDVSCDESEDTGVESGGNTKLEPIGFPSKAAKNVVKEHFKAMHEDDDSDTDIESAKYSFHSSTTPKSKSSPCLSLNKKELPPLPPKPNQANFINHPQPKSPMKHTRHKSMFNIDFDATSTSNSETLVTKLTQHERSKSVDLNSMVSKASSAVSQDQSVTSPLRLDTKEAAPEEMKIRVTEPPRPINYVVDFKEASGNDDFLVYPMDAPNAKEINMANEYENPGNSEGMYRISEGLNKLNINRGDNTFSHIPYILNQHHKYSHALKSTPYQVSAPTCSNMTTSNSGSSYQSSRTTKDTNYTSMSDSDSVVIDLTKDKYDVCMIQRNSSTQSYRSVTERTREGKEVEVVLVDDEEEYDDENDDETDELASIYSKYRNNWVSRTNSTASYASNSSTNSFESGVASVSQLKLKPTSSLRARQEKIEKSRSIDTLTPQIQKQRCSDSQTLPLSSSRIGYNSRRIQYPQMNGNSNNANQLAKDSPRIQANTVYGVPGSVTTPSLNSNYFDYASDNYDFKSFMKQQAASNQRG